MFGARNFEEKKKVESKKKLKRIKKNLKLINYLFILF